MHCCLRSTSETRRDLLSHNRKLAAPCRVDGRQISPSSLPWRSDPGAKNPTRRLADPRDHYYRTPIVPWGATVPPDRRLLSLYVSVVYVLCEYIQYIYVYVKRSALRIRGSSSSQDKVEASPRLPDSRRGNSSTYYGRLRPSQTFAGKRR